MSKKMAFLSLVILGSSFSTAASDWSQEQYQGKFRTLGSDEYISDLIRDSSGEITYVNDLQTASKICAELNGRIPSAPDFMTDSQLRDMGVSFKRLLEIDVARLGSFRPIPSWFDETEIYKKRLARIELFDSKGSNSIYYLGFQNYDLNADPYREHYVWTTDRMAKYSSFYDHYSISELKADEFVPVAAVGGGFDRLREGRAAVRCVVPKLRLTGADVLPCRNVSSFAEVGTRCLTSKKIEVERVVNRETGLLGWQDSSDGTIFLDQLTSADRKNDTFQSWSRNCRSKTKVNANVVLPTIDELMKLKTHGLNEILNETRPLWATTITPLATRPKLYRDVYSSLQGVPTIYQMDSGEVAGRCVIRKIK